MHRRFSSIAFALWLLFGSAVGGLAQGQAQAEARIVEAIPFVEEKNFADLEQNSEAFWMASSARRALGAGLYELAHSLAVRAEELLGEDVANIELRLISIDALLARSEWIAASERIEALADLAAAPLPAVSLRRAMIAFAEGDPNGVNLLLSRIEPSGLVQGDAPWYWFLRGWSLLRSGADAEPAFTTARQRARAQSPALGAQIGFLIMRSRIEYETADADTIPLLQNALLENAGREIRFVYAQQLAALLFDSNQTEEAIRLIERSLQTIPPELARERAQFQLLATMSAGLGRSEGRQHFNELIFSNRFPALMSIALQQAFSRARLDETETAPVLVSILDRVIESPTEHALLDQALYYRAVFRFLSEAYVGAEEDAATLQRRFPTSPYRRGMLALQASSAWNRNRFRTAASHLQQMRTEFADLEADPRLSALIADCYLRAGLQSNTREDYRNAAEAYATALAHSVDASHSGPLFFQLALSRLRAGQLEMALDVIDDPQLRALAGGEMVWRAEWLALKEMRRVRRVSEAYERVQEAIESDVSNSSLRLRLLWLAARLSVVSGEPEDTVDWVQRVDALAKESDPAVIDPELLGRVQASSLLSLAEARFAMEEPEEAVALLEQLRSEYPGSEPALFSFIAQARYLSSVNRTVEAQQKLVSLADEYKDNRLAPIALFEAALNAEQRGQDAYLDEATRLLQRIVSDYPDSEIVYRARLMQADLLRRLNKFDSAELLYKSLENEYADRPDRFLAQMSMADTLIAQAGEDPRNFDAAVSRLELLMDLPENLPDVPLDLRVEAGYKLGEAWRTRGETLKAKDIFWTLYDVSILEESRIRLMSRKGRYWLARCVFALAEISKDEGQIDQASMFYRQLVDLRLPGAELAKARLDILEEPVAN